MNELRDYYRGRIRERIAELEPLSAELAAGRAGDGERSAVRQVAHQLKGTGASYGFPAVSESAAVVDGAADDDLAGALADLLAVLHAELAEET